MSFFDNLLTKYQEYTYATWENSPFHESNPQNKFVHILPVTAIFLYILMLKFLPKITPKGGFGKFTIPMFIWNSLLTILSVIMFFGSIIPYGRFIYENGFWATICSPDYRIHHYSPSMLFWARTFTWSKYFELIDTFFIIIRGGKPQILHTWHHISVLAFTWYASYYRLSLGYLFLIVNSFIHMLMYYYYAIASIGFKPKWAFYLTMGQIFQMFIGMAAIGVWAYGTYFTDTPCSCTNPTIISISCFIMYASYAYLFIDFAIKRYCGSRKEKSGKGSKKQD